MRSRARWYVVALAASLALPVLPALSDSAASPAAHAGSRNATLGPLISGTSSYVDGTFVWTDYAYDDRGPDTDRLPGGDTVYPAGSEPGNAADLIQLQLGLEPDGRLRVGAVLETLVRPELALVGVGFDTDRNPATGAASVPGGQWTNDSRLGLERFVVLSSTGAQVLRATGGVWLPDSSGAATVDVPGNLLEAVVDLQPGQATWNAVGVVGLTGQESWRTGSGPIYDLAFVRGEEPNKNVAYKVIDSANQVKGQVTAGEGTSTEWQDKIQARVIAGTHATAKAVRAVDFGKVAGAHTALATPTAPWQTFLYYSPLNYGQGIQETDDGKRFAGPFQPYGVLFPQQAPTPTPLVVFMHGANENHLQNRVAFAATPAGEHVQPGYFDVPAITVFALGRDPNWGTPAAERDVLDIIADISSRYSIDDDRIVATGISAGGFGTFRMTELNPDLFAGGFSLVGGHTNGDTLPNLINTPIRMQNGAADPLVGPEIWGPTVKALSARDDIDFRSFQNANRSHTHVPALGNCILLDLIERGRVVDPARVIYHVDPDNEIDDPVTGLVAKHTDAFWVSGLQPRNPSATASINALSEARADRARTPNHSTTAHNNSAQGEDYCGPNPAVRTGDSWTEVSNTLTPGPKQQTRNGGTVVVRNLSTAAIDLSRMSITINRTVALRVSSDGATTLRLVGPWAGPVEVTRDGKPVATLTPSGGAVAVPVVQGTGAYRVIPAG